MEQRGGGNDQSQIHEDSGRYYGLIYIRAVSGGGGVKASVAVAKPFYVHFDGLPAPTSSVTVFRIAYMGPHQRWCVIRIYSVQVSSKQGQSRLVSSTLRPKRLTHLGHCVCIATIETSP
jgi:hypothetical protein